VWNSVILAIWFEDLVNLKVVMVGVVTTTPLIIADAYGGKMY
jgi:hypothetical protein